LHAKLDELSPAMTFTVKQSAFEGPLDLLLDLIEKRKLFVNDVSLAKVADDYIAYIRNLADFPVADSAHFILVASTLLLIKSKSLLPTLDLTTEEQASIDDLNRRLKIYERMRELSAKIKPMFGANTLYARGERKLDPVFSPDADMTAENFLLAAGRVLANLPKREFLPKVVVDKVISLETMIENLTRRVSDNLRMSFKQFSGAESKGEKVNIIVSFLAMLELVKQGVINVTQEKHFDDIQMETEAIGVPKY
jgi:segregation and condensation protein A